MAILKPDKVRTEYGLEIKEKIIPDGSAAKPNRLLLHRKPEYITIHNTDRIAVSGTTMSEQYARATHNGNMGGVSVHYYIDDKDCWQILKETEMGYHAADGKTGPGNGTSLAIEIIMDGSGKLYDTEAEDRGALLAAILLHRHGLGIDKLKTHKDWYPKKYCPVYILPHWDAFVKKVQTYLDAMEHPGDVDGDGKITTKDARLTLRAAIGIENLKRVQRVAADVNRDNKIDTADAREILRKSIGLEEKPDGE